MKLVKRNRIIVVMLCLVLGIIVPVHVQAAPKVKLNKNKMAIVVGQQKTLKVKNTTQKVTWSSSQKTVAKVDSKGVVTAKKAGTTTITAKVGKKKYTCAVTVKEKPSLVRNETICVGRKLKLTVEGTAQKVKWSSSNKRIVKVDKKGNIRGLRKGTATITAQVGDKALKCKVKVKDAVTKIDRTIRVKDSGFVIISHWSDSISCKISNPEIATITVTDSEEEEHGLGRESTIVIYAKKSGTAYISVANDCNDKKMKFKVVVQKTSPITPKDKVKDYLIHNGNTGDECNKVISKSFSIYQSNATITYNYWDKSLEYEYAETKDGVHVKWCVLGTEDPKSGTYIVMWITPKGETESQYITAEVDLTTYNGETLVYEEGWYKIAADAELQRIANEVTPRAYGAMDELLKPVGVTFRDQVIG